MCEPIAVSSHVVNENTHVSLFATPYLLVSLHRNQEKAQINVIIQGHVK